jgi:hypothetical protein
MKKSLFSASRQIFKGPQARTDSAQEGASLPEAEQQAEKPVPMQELNDKAKEALATARAEKENIERRYGKAKTAAELPENTPSEIRAQYEKLIETINRLQASIGRQRQIMEESLKAFDEIVTNLDAYAAKEKKYSSSGDPMFAFPYERAPKPSAPPVEEAAPAPEIKPAVKAPERKETREQVNDRVTQEFCQKIKDGSNEVTPEEAAVLKATLRSGELGLVDLPDGSTVDLELSKDGKWVRTIGHSAPDERSGAIKETFTVVLPLEEGEESRPEFALKTTDELTAARIESNKRILKDQLAWLNGDEAPIGSTVILFSKEFKRKNNETQEDETGLQSSVVRKGVNGLRMATLEYLTDENGTPKSNVKEVPPEQTFTMEKAMAMVGDGATTVSEGGEKDRKAELKRELNRLGEQLIGQIPFGGVESPNFQNTLREMKRIFDQHNVTKWSYKDHILGHIQRYEKGTLTIYDPDKKNPEYVSPEKTPDMPRYAVNMGPIDMARYVESATPERKAA